MIMTLCVGPDQLDRAADALRGGQLVAFATETVYGLGANALDAAAVARVFEAKGRPRFDPLIVHVANVDAARRLAAHWPPAAQRLAEAFWPGPMTLVVEKSRSSKVESPESKTSDVEPRTPDAGPIIPDLVTAGLPTVALRVPGHKLARALIQRAGVPVAAPSANRFGGVSPTRAEHVVAELGEAVDVVLDGGPCATGVESTVVSVVGGGDRGEGQGVTVLRLGGLAVEQIEQVVGPVRVAMGGAGAEEEAAGDQAAAARAGLASPGMLARHYAPRTPMVVVDHVEPTSEVVAAEGDEPVAVMLFADRPGLRAALAKRGVTVRTLSEAGDLKEAAANLFATLRELDAAGAARIVAERVPDRGLGRAINDRLRRASTPA